MHGTLPSLTFFKEHGALGRILGVSSPFNNVQDDKGPCMSSTMTRDRLKIEINLYVSFHFMALMGTKNMEQFTFLIF